MTPWSKKRRRRASPTPPPDEPSYEDLEKLRRALEEMNCSPHVAGIADLTKPDDDISGRFCMVHGPYPDEGTAWTEAQKLADSFNVTHGDSGVFVPFALPLGPPDYD